MPIVTTTPAAGYATCARSRTEHGSCPGYDSRPIPVLIERTDFLYSDYNAGSHDPYDAIVANLTHHSVERVHAADEADNQCAECGGPVNVSIAERPRYARMSAQSPDELVERAEAERARAAREQGALTAQERSAAAQEQLAMQNAAHDAQQRALLERQVAAAERANELEAIRLGLEANGAEPAPRPSDVKPRAPRRRSPA